MSINLAGLLTVDATKRLSLAQVLNADWITCMDVPNTPLMTPGTRTVPTLFWDDDNYEVEFERVWNLILKQNAKFTSANNGFLFIVWGAEG